MSKMTFFTVDNFHRDKDGNSYIDFEARGSKEGLVNLLACAMDYREVRELLYEAVELDRQHAKTVGRHNDLNAIVDIDHDNSA